VQADELPEDRRRVAIVDAALVALAVAIGSVLAHELEQPAALPRGSDQHGEIEASAAGLGVREHRVRQVLAPVDVFALADDLLRPQRSCLLEFVVADRLDEIRARDAERHRAVVRDDGELERLAVHAEPVTAELDQGAAVGKEIESVAQASQRVLARSLEA
jgi:hypothetical protein